VVASSPVTKGDAILAASFEKDGNDMPTNGFVSLHINDQKVREAEIRTQPGKFALSSEGLNIGRDGADPVTQDYPGERPWELTGATIEEVILDVSGEGFIDLEKEAAGAFMRD
jgi:arylsulfatase